MYMGGARQIRLALAALSASMHHATVTSKQTPNTHDSQSHTTQHLISTHIKTSFFITSFPHTTSTLDPSVYHFTHYLFPLLHKPKPARDAPKSRLTGQNISLHPR